MSENIFKSVHVRPTWMFKGIDDIVILFNTVFRYAIEKQETNTFLIITLIYILLIFHYT